MAIISDSDVERIANALSVKLTQGEGAAAFARAAAYAAVQEHAVKSWAQLGYNLADTKDIERLHKNLAFMETLRMGSSRVANAAMTAIATAVVLAILTWIAIGAKFSLGTTTPVK